MVRSENGTGSSRKKEVPRRPNGTVSLKKADATTWFVVVPKKMSNSNPQVRSII